jgi:Cu(I)/Ag(I) efflux system membrane fusion protein
VKKLIFILPAIFCLSCQKKEIEKEYFRKVAPDTVRVTGSDYVKTSQVEMRLYPHTVSAQGKVAIPDKDLLILSARSQGRIDQIRVVVGDSVKPGQIIAQVWSPDFANAAEEWLSAVKQNNSDLLSLTREKLKAMGISPEDIKGGSQVLFPIHAPMGGVVLDKKVSVGSAVNPGDVILTIGKIGSYQFQGEVSPDEVQQVKVGMTVLFDDRDDLKAVIESVSPVADPTTRLCRVRGRFTTEKASNLSPESLLRGNVVIKEERALLVPAKAIIRESHGEFAFVKKAGAGNEFKKIAILVDRMGFKDVAIQASNLIKEGDEVVSKGALQLSDVLSGDE